MQPLTAQNPLIKQLFEALTHATNNYFTQPTVQSPVPQTQFPTGFQQSMGQHVTYPGSQTPQPTTMPTATPKQSWPLGPTIDRTSTPTSVPNVSQSFIDVLNNKILPITRQYGIPDSVAAAQAAHESGYGSSPAAKNLNNYFGLMHFDPKTKQRSIHQFNSVEDAAHFYGQTVQALVPNVTQMKDKPMEVLKALQSGKSHYEADNPNPSQYVYDVSQNPLWGKYGGGSSMTTNPRGWK